MLALAVRIVRILLFTHVVEIEGSEYGRIAESLVRDGAYVGLMDGPELMLPPLYSLGMAATMKVTGVGAETAGRAVSCLASLVTVLACWVLAARVAGRRAAWWTGVLVALGPAFVLTGAAVFSESLTIMAMALGALCFERAAATRRLAWAASTGVAFGLAYLARVEMVLLGPAAAILLALRTGDRAPHRSRWFAPSACLMAFGLVALPYPIWVHGVTDEATFAGKSARVFATIDRFSRGMTLEQANYAVDAEGRQEGTWLEPNTPWRGPGAFTLFAENPSAIASHVFHNGIRNAWTLVSGKGVVSLLWLLPVWLALRDRGRSRSTRSLDALLLVMGLYIFATASVYKTLIRYLAPLALPAALGAGRGLAGRPWAAVGCAILILSSLRGVLHGHGEFAESGHLVVEELAQVVGEHVADGDLVMASDSRVPFHAGARWVPTPVSATSEGLLAFARSKGATLLVIMPRSANRRPGGWFDADSLPADMTLLHGTSDGGLVLRLR